jgi:hypothetical protein
VGIAANALLQVGVGGSAAGAPARFVAEPLRGARNGASEE